MTKYLSSTVCAKILLCTVVAGVSMLSGCASTTQYTPGDPLEPINRVTHEFNSKVDKYALKPVAKIYDKVTPTFVRTCVTNFFANLGEVPTGLNDLLQGQIKNSANDFGRFAINTTVGIGGTMDVATRMGLERRYNDLGITLGVWGIKEAPYIVIPFIGPSTLRDGLALWPYYEYFTLWPYIRPIKLRNGLFALDVVNLRASLLDSEEVMDQAAIDRYVFIRNAYLQKRASLIAENSGQKTSQGLGSYEDEEFAFGDDDEDTEEDTSDDDSTKGDKTDTKPHQGEGDANTGIGVYEHEDFAFDNE